MNDKTNSFNDALKVVKEAVENHKSKLLEMSDNDECEPVYIEGRSSAGVIISGHVHGDVLAKILLAYDYSVFSILGYTPPEKMLEEVADKFGFDSVDYIDL